MTRQDIDNLFSLLEIYFPNSPKTKDKRLKNAWALLLEPYSPDDVKSALLERLRESSFFPDPQSLAVKCQNRVNGSAVEHGKYQPSKERIDAFAVWIDGFLDEHHPGWRDEIAEAKML